MRIRNICLGGAAVLAWVPAAMAADAVVIADPEPVEYVRVCDVYGSGFFYIPGTENCLKISGYLRHDIGFGDLVQYGETVDLDRDGDGDTYYRRTRFALRVDARSETELGTLRAYTQLLFNYTRNAAGVSQSTQLNQAFIEIGGFRVGVADSNFLTYTNYGGTVHGDDLAVPYGPLPRSSNQISYSFKLGGGVSGLIALEEGAGDFTIDSYVPHIVAGLTYTADWGAIYAVGGYDSIAEEGAFKVRLEVKPTERLFLYAMAGYSTNDAEGFIGNVDRNNYYAQWNGDWAAWAGGSFKATEKIVFNASFAYDEDENFAAVANIGYSPVKNLTIWPEIRFKDNFQLEDGDALGGFVRVQRNF